MSLFGLKFTQMILHTETSKLMYNWSFLFEVLHKPTLLPSTFNEKVLLSRDITFHDFYWIQDFLFNWEEFRGETNFN